MHYTANCWIAVAYVKSKLFHQTGHTYIHIPLLVLINCYDGSGGQVEKVGHNNGSTNHHTKTIQMG